MIYAASSHAARRELARRLGVDAIDIVASVRV